MADEDYSEDSSEEEGGERKLSLAEIIDIESEDVPNIATQLLAAGEEGQEYIDGYLVSKVLLEYEMASDSMEQYRKKVADDLLIFYGEMPPKKPPFDKLANLNIPIALQNITRLVNRGEGELFGDWTNIHGVTPNGPDDRVYADDLSRHGNWQLSEQIPDFKRQQRRGMLMFYSVGDVTGESFYDTQRKHNRHVTLTPDEFYVPYTLVSVMPDWSDVPYRGRIYDYYRHEMEGFYGIWDSDQLDKVLNEDPAFDSDDPDQPLTRRMTRLMGTEEPADGPAPYRVLRHETWCKLPGQERQRFVRAEVELSRRILLRLTLHEVPDWGELARYEMQTQELDAYMQARAQFDMMIGDPMALAAGMVPPEPPPRPHWMGDDEDARPQEPRLVPRHQFTHAVCIEPLRGTRGFGLLNVQAPINRFGNSALNHEVDSATLDNFPPLLIDADAGLKKLVVGAGELTPVQTDGQRTVRDMVHNARVARHTGSMLELVKWAQELGSASIQSPEVLSGEPGKSGESARGLMARIGEATKNIAVYTRAYADQFLVPILYQNARLNAIFMPDDEVFLITDEEGQTQKASIGRAMYRRMPFKVKIRADLRFSSDQERIQQADQLVGMSIQDPYLQGNAAFAWHARERALRARGLADMVPLLGPAPPNPPQVPMQDARMMQQPGMPTPPGQQGAQGPEPAEQQGQPPRPTQERREDQL